MSIHKMGNATTVSIPRPITRLFAEERNNAPVINCPAKTIIDVQMAKGVIS